MAAPKGALAAGTGLQSEEHAVSGLCMAPKCWAGVCGDAYRLLPETLQDSWPLKCKVM